MSNKNYVKGRRKEYALVHDYKAQGCDIAFRSAGSHSPIDVVAIDKTKKIIYLIQAKPDNMNETNKRKLLKEHKELNNKYQVKWLIR